MIEYVMMQNKANTSSGDYEFYMLFIMTIVDLLVVLYDRIFAYTN